MKKIILLAAFAFFTIASFSQDRILMKKGTKIDVIVTEITPTLVRYKLLSEPDGRTYFAYKDDVASITYKDGRVETFNQSGDQVVENKNNPKENQSQKQTQNKKQTQTPNRQSNPVVKKQENVENQSQSVDNWNQNNDYLQSDGKEKDIVYLTDGSIVRGTILVQDPNKPVEIKTANGKIVTCQMDDIDKIVAGTSVGSYNPRGSSSGPSGRNSSGFSGGSSSELNSGYRGIIDLGYYYGVGTYQIDRVNFNFINGYQINPYFYVGIGIGVHYYYTDFSQPSDNAFLIPFFADLRANFINGPVSPYLSCDIGYSFNASDSFNGEGILINPTAGVSFKVSERNEIHIGVGYQLQGFRVIYYYYDGNDYNYFSNSSHINAGALAFKVGFSF